MFMGGEFGQWHEWRDYEDLAWGALAASASSPTAGLERALNRLYREYPELHASDDSWEGFAGSRWTTATKASLLFCGSACRGRRHAAHRRLQRTPVPRESTISSAYPTPGRYRKILDSDAPAFAGSGFSAQVEVEADRGGWHDFPAHIRVDLPPLAVTIWERVAD